MGMSIDDVKEEFISILTEIEITGGSMVTSIYKDELKMAIDIMHKYQRIEEIVKNSNGLLDGTLEHAKAFVKICEVLEDGNDDN